MQVILVAGHLEKEFVNNYLRKIPADTKLVGIDYGAYFLASQGYPLDLAIGDFDSLTVNEKEQVKKVAKQFILLPTEKNDTDTQAALSKAIAYFPESDTYLLLGATGGRLDHFLANLFLPLENRFYSSTEKIQLRDEKNWITYFLPGKHTIKKDSKMTYLAYVPLTPMANLTLEKSRYLLQNKNIANPFAYPSNEFIGDKASFSFDSGILAVIQSRD